MLAQDQQAGLAAQIDAVQLAVRMGLTRGPEEAAARYLAITESPRATTPGVPETWEAARASSRRVVEACSPMARTSSAGTWGALILVLAVAGLITYDGRRNQIPAWWAFALATPLLCAVVAPLYLWRRRDELQRRRRAP